MTPAESIDLRIGVVQALREGTLPPEIDGYLDAVLRGLTIARRAFPAEPDPRPEALSPGAARRLSELMAEALPVHLVAPPPAPSAPPRSAEPISTPAPKPAPAPAILFTPERVALLRAGWPDMSVTRVELAAQLNALPGAPVAEGSLAWAAERYCDLPKSRMAAADLAAAPPAPAFEPETLAPPAEPTPALETHAVNAVQLQAIRAAAPDPSAEDRRAKQMAEARALLDRGRSADQIRREINISAEDLRIVAEQRQAEGEAREAARTQTAATLLRDGETPDHVARVTRLPLREVLRIKGDLRREISA